LRQMLRAISGPIERLRDPLDDHEELCRTIDDPPAAAARWRRGGRDWRR
jgi:hypothetical protein